MTIQKIVSKDDALALRANDIEAEIITLSQEKEKTLLESLDSDAKPDLSGLNAKIHALTDERGEVATMRRLLSERLKAEAEKARGVRQEEAGKILTTAQAAMDEALKELGSLHEREFELNWQISPMVGVLHADGVLDSDRGRLSDAVRLAFGEVSRIAKMSTADLVALETGKT